MVWAPKRSPIKYRGPPPPLKWGWKTTWDKIGSPSHPRSPLGLPLGSFGLALASLWLPFGSFGYPLASPFAPLTSLWSPFGLGTPLQWGSKAWFPQSLDQRLGEPTQNFKRWFPQSSHQQSGEPEHGTRLADPKQWNIHSFHVPT